MAELFAFLSAAILVVGAPPYLIDILKHKTKPERATWFIWSVQGVVAFITQVQFHAHWSLWFAGINAAGNLSVFLLSLKYGIGGWKRLDIVALIIALIGIIVSIGFKAPLIALLGVILADFAGVVPTLIKTYQQPDTETAITWLALGTSALLAIFSVGSYKFDLLLYPLYFTISNYAVSLSQGLGYQRQKMLKLKG